MVLLECETLVTSSPDLRITSDPDIPKQYPSNLI